MKKILSIFLAFLFISVPAYAIETVPEESITIPAPYAILMEKTTGEIIYEKSAYEHVYPASVTKIMTLLLVMEAIDSGTLALDDMVTTSSRAASMGGSQIWLEEGEQMSVDEMLKCATVVSANDCCVALAEHIAGSEEAFVDRMNEKATELGMDNTHFTNCSGLMVSDDHYTCAYDTAVMSRALISYEKIKDYTTIWMDTARDGQFGLSNTNKLIYYYEGATGLKTGFTSQALHCLSATAERDGVEYIAVVFKAQSSNDRFESAKTLLNYAFANYTLMPLTPSEAIAPLDVTLGDVNSVQPVLGDSPSILIKKSDVSSVKYELDLPEGISAPINAGQQLGTLKVYIGDKLYCDVPLVAENEVCRITIGKIFASLVKTLLGVSE